jgi:DNA end-binding protein Ku
LAERTAGGELQRRAFWSGTLTFGLVSIPVALLPAARPGGVSLRMLAPDGTPLQRRYTCPKEDRPLSWEEIVRGFEWERGRYVILSDDELEALEPEKSRDIDLRRFVPVEQIDPIYFDRPYFLAPAGTSTRPYRLLADTMERTGRAGIGTFVMRSKEYLVAILAERGILRAETLRFADEVRSAEDVGLPTAHAVGEAEIDRMTQAIRGATKKLLDTEALKDRYAAELLRLVERKRASGDGVIGLSEEAPPEEERFVDLMELLKKSMQGSAAHKGAAGRR